MQNQTNISSIKIKIFCTNRQRINHLSIINDYQIFKPSCFPSTFRLTDLSTVLNFPSR